MVIDFKVLRPSPLYPTYPPYHTGPYLEEYFYEFYKKNKKQFDNINFTLIPAFWTNLYLNGISNNIIQEYINLLPNGRYFTVCQFDDGIQESLPSGTINFVAGGNKPGIPIPLICSPIPELYTFKKQHKDIFCSFVGTTLQNEKYKCRLKLYELYGSDSKFYFSKPRSWSNQVNDSQFNEFVNITRRSRFTLCPRGYGLQSFRLYEAIQLGSIPVFVYDKPFFPFENFIDWDSFCVRVHLDEINNLKDKLENISEDVQIEMLNQGNKIYHEFFTLPGMCNGIYKSLERLK